MYISVSCEIIWVQHNVTQKEASKPMPTNCQVSSADVRHFSPPGFRRTEFASVIQIPRLRMFGEGPQQKEWFQTFKQTTWGPLRISPSRSLEKNMAEITSQPLKNMFPKFETTLNTWWFQPY